MERHPDSFTENIAWGETGLRNIHTAIRRGFKGVLAPVDRNTFRERSRVGQHSDLIPVNLFLHNRRGQVSIDEFVVRAIKHDHSPIFDHLALFVLHLNQGGAGESKLRPATWANEFVRDRLWSNGSWQASALSDESLDRFLLARIDAQEKVRTQCRNNYRRLFELCNLLPSSFSTIDSAIEQWLDPALFIVWDRHILDTGVHSTTRLLEVIDRDQIHKLVGTERDYVLARAHHLVSIYEDIGALDRFKSDAVAPSRSKLHADDSILESGEDMPSDGSADEGIHRRIEVQRVAWMKQVRDRRKSAVIKQRYNNTCQFCGTRLQASESLSYSEAVHIKAVNYPHNGPDRMENMLVLCPNHHIQFDHGILCIEKMGSDYTINSTLANDPLHGKTITLRHDIRDEYVRHHFDRFR